jgi:hypothetical protein
MVRNWRLLCLLLVAGLLVGCKPPPTDMFVQKTDDIDTQIGPLQKIVVLCDACCVYDTRQILVDDSQRAEGFLLNEACRMLREKNYTPHAELACFVGGYKEPTETFAVSFTKSQDPQSIKPPFFQDAQLASDEAYRNALQYIEHFSQVCFDMGFNRGARFSVNPIAMESLRVIGQRTGADAVLVINAHGNYVPTSKSVGQGLATGLITGVLTLGTVVVVAYDISHVDSYVALIDVKDGRMLWSNSLRLTHKHPQDENCYKDRWGHQLLYHLPARLPAGK